MQQYILLIYENEAEAKSRNAEEGQRIFGEYVAFTASVKPSDPMRAGEPLEPTRTATTVRVKAGKRHHGAHPRHQNRLRRSAPDHTRDVRPRRYSTSSAACSWRRTSPSVATSRAASPKP
jgi:hypothetical protein